MNPSISMAERGTHMPHQHFALWAILVVVSTVGCGPKIVNTELPAPRQNLIYLASAYQQFQTENSGKGPKSIRDLMPCLEKFGEAENMLISPRDSEAYQIVWGINSKSVSANNVPIIAYEKTGADGVHLAVDFRPWILELSDADVEKLK